MAVADYAEGFSDQQPPVLGTALSCQRWNTLPEAGGLDDQPLGLIVQMEVALNVFNVCKSYAEAENTIEWAERFPDLDDAYTSILKIRDEAAGD